MHSLSSASPWPALLNELLSKDVEAPIGDSVEEPDACAPPSDSPAR